MSGALAGRVAIVTGAGRGIGRAIAERFAHEGAKVGLVARSQDQLDEVAAAIRDTGGDALACAGDVTSRADVERICADVADRFGPVTLLVNNAGVPGPFGPIGEVDPDDWWAAQKVHQYGPLLFIGTVLPGMRRAGGGRIINISAIASQVVAPNLSAYCTGKTAQNRIAEHVDAENRDHNVRVFILHPGMILTRLAEDTAADPDAQKWLPGMAERIGNLRGTPEGTSELPRCVDACLSLAEGGYDALSARYLDAKWDFDAKLEEIRQAELSPTA